MPRTLPWLTQAKKANPHHSSSSPAPKRKRPSTPTSDLDLVDSDLNITPSPPPKSKARGTKPNRSPSTSPPPAPPSVEYMREGFAQDDIWRMVEDEFYSTAQLYTQHIHHAEYVRLKKLAKSRGQSTLRALRRGTDGRTERSEASKMRVEGEEKGRKAREGVKALVRGGGDGESSEDEDEDEWMMDPQLAGLMTASQRSGQDLTGVAKARANTRAAAGFERSPRKERTGSSDQFVRAGSTKKTAAKQKQPAGFADQESSEDDDDGDLDGKPAALMKQRPALAEQPRNGFFKRFAGASSEDPQPPHEKAKPATVQTSKRPTNGERPTVSSSKAVSARSTKAAETAGPEEDEYTASMAARSQATTDFLAKRRAAKAAKEKKDQDSARGTGSSRSTAALEVPTFIL